MLRGALPAAVAPVTSQITATSDALRNVASEAHGHDLLPMNADHPWRYSASMGTWVPCCLPTRREAGAWHRSE